MTKLPVQSTQHTFGDSVNALHLNVARQILTITRSMRTELGLQSGGQCEASRPSPSTPTPPMHTLYGQQMGGRKGYNPKNKGKEELPA